MKGSLSQAFAIALIFTQAAVLQLPIHGQIVPKQSHPLKGAYTGTFTFSSGSKGLVDIAISPDGKLIAHFNNQTGKYTYDVEGTIDPNGKFSGRVIFNGKDWGAHKGTFAKAANGKLTGKIDETPNGKEASWGTYQIEMRPKSAAEIAKAKPAAPGIVTKNPVVYTVTMATTFVVPVGNDKIEQVRVYHALPTPRPWSESKPTGAHDIAFTPNTAKVEYHQSTDSRFALWTVNGKQRPGTKLTFAAAMTIRSTERDVYLPSGTVTWAAYAKNPTDKTAIVDAAVLKSIHPELAKTAAKFKAELSPPDAVRAMCKWIVDNIKYNASVTFPPADIASIVRQKCGHCGHQAAVFGQLTASAGIPMRSVFGMNLYAPDGRTGPLQAIRADFTNIHMWAEVYFPGFGWVEVDPGLGARAFSVPANLIQNNRWFQNYSIWMREGGMDKQPPWIPNNGSFRSDYGVEHIIMYAVKQGK